MAPRGAWVRPKRKPASKPGATIFPLLEFFSGRPPTRAPAVDRSKVVKHQLQIEAAFDHDDDDEDDGYGYGHGHARAPPMKPKAGGGGKNPNSKTKAKAQAPKQRLIEAPPTRNRGRHDAYAHPDSGGSDEDEYYDHHHQHYQGGGYHTYGDGGPSRRMSHHRVRQMEHGPSHSPLRGSAAAATAAARRATARARAEPRTFTATSRQPIGGGSSGWASRRWESATTPLQM